jgi:hypothetical protein
MPHISRTFFDLLNNCQLIKEELVTLKKFCTVISTAVKLCQQHTCIWNILI